MTARVEQALDAYQRLEVETGVAAASPQKLVVMLYEGAVRAIYNAKAAVARKDVGARGASISRAIAIIDSMRPRTAFTLLRSLKIRNFGIPIMVRMPIMTTTSSISGSV